MQRQILNSLVLIAGAASFMAGCAPAQQASTAPAPAPQTETVANAPGTIASAGPAAVTVPTAPAPTLRIGPSDVLEIAVFDVPELTRSARVAETGMISLPLLGEVRAAGRTPRELEVELETVLRKRYMKDPHVSVQISEMQSHGISVVGAVAKPGVFQVRDPRSLLEVIALAGGLTQESGENIIVIRGSSARASGATTTAQPKAIEVGLKGLLESGDSRSNIAVYPGDIVKVLPAGLVYVVGEVKKPGAFPLDRRAGMTVLQAVALSEGFGPKAAKSRAMVIRTTDAGQRKEIQVDVGAVLSGKQVDLALEPKDVVFIPGSAMKSFTKGTIDALVRMVTFRGII